MPQPPLRLLDEPVSRSDPRRIQCQRSPPHSQASGSRNTGTPRAPIAAMTPELSFSNARSASSEGFDSDTPLDADNRPDKRKRPVAEDPNGLPRRRRRHAAVDDGVAFFQSHMSDVSGNIDDLWENITNVATQHTIFRNETKNVHSMQDVQLKAHNKNIEEIWVWVKRRDGIPAKLEKLKAQVNKTEITQERIIEQLQQEMRDIKLTFDEALKKAVSDVLKHVTDKMMMEVNARFVSQKVDDKEILQATNGSQQDLETRVSTLEQFNKFEDRIEKLEADHDVRDVTTKSHQRRIKKLEEARFEIVDGFKTIKDTLPTLATTNAITQLVKDSQDAMHYACNKRNTELESSLQTNLDSANTKLDITNTKLNTTNAKLETEKTSLEDFQDAPRPETQVEPHELPNGTPSNPPSAKTQPRDDFSFSAPWPKLIPIALPVKPTATPTTATNEEMLPPPSPTSQSPLSPLPRPSSSHP